MTIFQISEELRNVFAELEENGGELTEEIAAKLAVNEQDFKTKIKSYGEVIRATEGEIKTIDTEIDRLKSVKESKQKAIDRLNKVLIWAVTTFGEQTKNGGMYVDYVTGKISVRNSEKIEINSYAVDNTVNNLFSYLNVLSYTKELNDYNGVDIEEALEAIKISENGVEITEEELENINASITFDVNLRDILKGDGFNFIRHLLSYSSKFKAKSNISKSDIKAALSEGINLKNIAEIVPNKTVNIK